MHEVTTLSLGDAWKAAMDIQEAAMTDPDHPVSVCVSDMHGNPILFFRMDGATLSSLRNAQDKCFTAATFERDTAALEALVEQQPHYRDKMQLDPRYCFLGGGVVVRNLKDDHIVGVIAVSGRHSQDDHTLAKAGVQSIWRDLR